MDIFANELRDILSRCTGEKDFGDALLLKFGDVFLRNNSSQDYQSVLHSLFAQQRNDSRAQRVMRAAQDRHSDCVNVLLQSRRRDHLRGLTQAGVDDFHAGIAQRARDYLGAAIVTIEAGFGNQNTNLLLFSVLRLCELRGKVF